MKIVNKIHLMAFGLGLVYIGMSSFKGEYINQSSITFYHVGDEYLSSPPDLTTCKSDVDGYCTITYTGSNLPSGSFDESNIPPAIPGQNTRTLDNPNKSWY